MSSGSSTRTSTGSASAGRRWSPSRLLGIWKGVGWSMLIFLAALTGVPRELHEAAASTARALRALPHVTLPLIRGAVAAVVICW